MRILKILNIIGLVTLLSLIAPSAYAACSNPVGAVLSDNTAKCWGVNVHGELGDGTNTNSSTPVTVIFP